MTASVSADVVVRSIHAMADGDRSDFDALYDPRGVDRENRIQPPSSRVPGAAGFYSTALWLRAAFADLHYDIHHAVADGDLVAVNSTMNGRHVEPWAVYHEDAPLDTVFPPTNRIFAAAQSHWFRLEDGRIVERALGQPGRPRHGATARVAAAVADVPGADGGGEAARGPRRVTRRRIPAGQKSRFSVPETTTRRAGNDDSPSGVEGGLQQGGQEVHLPVAGSAIAQGRGDVAVGRRAPAQPSQQVGL